MKAIVFDVDNTLYDAEQYFSGAFLDVAKFLSKKYNLPEVDIYEKLMSIWKKSTSMYAHLFDDLFDMLGIENGVAEVVKLFNDYNGELEPYPGTRELLNSFKDKGFMLGIITDGTAHRQKRKLRLLGLESLFDVMVFTHVLGHSKLTEYPFRKALEELDVTPEDSIYVGDNPHLDFKGAKEIGILTVRLLKGEFKQAPKDKYIDHEISELIELTGLL